jgi:formyl-CoA transferase
VLAVNDEQWRRIFPALGRPDLVKDPRFCTTSARVRNYDELYGIVAEQLKLRTTAEWHDILDKEDIPNGPMRSLQELLHDQYLNDTGFFLRYDHPSEGPARTVMPPMFFSGTPVGMHRPPPLLGEHNQSVLTEIGYSDSEISQLTR